MDRACSPGLFCNSSPHTPHIAVLCSLWRTWILVLLRMISPVDTGKAWEECRCTMMYFSSNSYFLSLGFERKLRMRADLFLSPIASNNPVLVRLTHRRSSGLLKGIFHRGQTALFGGKHQCICRLCILIQGLFWYL